MPRSRNTVPKYLFHVSGQARVSIAGRDIYLGKYGTPESLARYHTVLAEYANTGSLPDESPSHQINEVITVANVVADYRARVLPRYEHNHGSHARQSVVISTLDERYGSTAASEFGPRKLTDMRDAFVAKGNSRWYCNQQTRDVVRLFKYAVSRELAPETTWRALESLEPLKQGEAPDRPKRGGVPLEVVQATLPHLSDVLVAMVKLQLATACRPSELHSMTPSQIDRSGDAWIYKPGKHKTQHHDKTRAIPIVGGAVQILSPYLFGSPQETCFLTSKGTPWNKDSYRRQITRGAKAADQPHWTPYQLRHTTAQRVRDELGAEAVQALLGHSRLATSEIYSEASQQRAIEAAKIVCG